MVDTDTYVSLVNFPVIATGSDGVYNLAKGAELVQVFPFPVPLPPWRGSCAPSGERGRGPRAHPSQHTGQRGLVPAQRPRQPKDRPGPSVSPQRSRRA